VGIVEKPQKKLAIDAFLFQGFCIAIIELNFMSHSRLDLSETKIFRMKRKNISANGNGKRKLSVKNSPILNANLAPPSTSQP
jgi:hypothetical protein